MSSNKRKIYNSTYKRIKKTLELTKNKTNYTDPFNT